MTKKFDMLYEATVNKTTEEVKKFMEKIETEYKKLFPKGWMNIRLDKGLGKEQLYLVFGIQPKEKWSSNLMDNDPGLQKMFIYGITSEGVGDKLEADMITGGSLTVKPEEGSYMAFGRVKFGWRKKSTGSLEDMEKHLINYFKKMKKVVEDNKDNLAHDIG